MTRFWAIALLAMVPIAAGLAQTGGDKAGDKGEKKAVDKASQDKGDKQAQDKGDKDKGEKKAQDEKKLPDKGEKKLPDKGEKKGGKVEPPEKEVKIERKDPPVKPDFQVEGELTNTGTKDKRTGTASKSYPYKMQAGVYYTIRMRSDDVDAYLFLEDGKGKIVGENDDEVPQKLYDAMIVFKCLTDGEYKIICTAHPKSDNAKLKLVGKYTLMVYKSTKAEIEALPKYKGAPEHEAMVGKPAPDIAGDFSINGNAKKLSELKGKVVLVDFWAVWCGPCIATFPHLRDWANDHQKDGLEVVGITSYFKKYGFDKLSAKLVGLDDDELLTPAEEHGMVKDFAAHHNLSHQLLMVPIESWRKAGKDYHIEGIPTMVLIDRAGNVRMIRVGSDLENAGDMDEAIHKLLAEK